MDELNSFVIAYLRLVQDRRARSEQMLLTEAARVSQGANERTHTCQRVLTDLSAVYTNANLSFYDICPVDSFERVN